MSKFNTGDKVRVLEGLTPVIGDERYLGLIGKIGLVYKTEEFADKIIYVFFPDYPNDKEFGTGDPMYNLTFCLFDDEIELV